MQHIVVQRHDIALRNAANVDLHRRAVNDEHRREVDKHIGHGVQQRRDAPDEFVKARKLAVALFKFLNGLLLAAKRAYDAHAGEVFARHARDAVKPRLHLLEQRYAHQHDGKHDREQHRDSHGIHERALHINSERHYHCAEHDERASQQQPQPHVHAVLHLIYIIGEARYQRVRAEGVQLRERQALDMVEHRLPQLCRKADARLRREILRRDAAQQPQRRHQQQHAEAAPDVAPVIVGNADVYHPRHDDGDKQVKHDLQQLEQRREYALLGIVLEIDRKISQVFSTPVFISIISLDFVSIILYYQYE